MAASRRRGALLRTMTATAALALMRRARAAMGVTLIELITGAVRLRAQPLATPHGHGSFGR
jgi:hypothetical protein